MGEWRTMGSRRVGLRTVAGVVALSVVGLLAGVAMALEDADGLFGEPETATAWFERARPHCTAGEAEAWLADHPAPPKESASAGYTAVCYAMAHRYDEARAAIEALPRGPSRSHAMGPLGQQIPVVEERGNAEAAAWMLDYLARSWPTHRRLRRQAGMAAYALGQHENARTHLQAYLEGWSSRHIDSPWTRGPRGRAMRALDVMAQIDAGLVTERPPLD